VSYAGARLIRAATKNAYVLTSPTLARRDAQVPRLHSRLVKILNVAKKLRFRFLLARGLIGQPF
jgi:hypothetical protein